MLWSLTAAALLSGAVARRYQPPGPSAAPAAPVDTTSRVIARPGRSAARSYPTPVRPRSGRSSSALGGLTDSSLWPAPVSETHSSVSGWKFLGNNVAAVSPDCPFLAHGDGSSLADCQSGCAGYGSCNVLNWNPEIGDCVFRACDNPLAPTL